MKKLKKVMYSFVLSLAIVTTMSLPVFAKENNNQISTYAVISSCPVCMGRNISTNIYKVTYDYEGQTRYVTEHMFDYCRDCGFRTPDRTHRYKG